MVHQDIHKYIILRANPAWLANLSSPIHIICVYDPNQPNPLWAEALPKSSLQLQLQVEVSIADISSLRH